MTMPRVLAPEALDQLPAADPAARRSRRDLVRIHRAMGTRAIVARGWQALLSPQRPAAPLQILELGAGDGSLLLGVARALAPTWPQVQLTLQDRLALVGPATLAGYGALGWAARQETGDVLDWAASAAVARPWDLISTALFLHHFEGAQLAALLAAVARRGRRFFACEPRRGWPALAGSHCVGALGAGAVTRQDAVLSVRAGFRGREITALWPRQESGWQLREYAAGPFSHCFSASRSGAA
jgi:hypothetical protein